MRASVAGSTQLSMISSLAATAAISSQRGGAVKLDAAYADDVAGDFNAQGAQQQLGKGSGGYARGGLAGRGALQHVAGVGEVVFESAGKVGVARPRRSDGLVLGRVAGFDRELFFPVLPVAVDDLDGDGRADGLAVAHAAEHVGLVGFNLHAAAAAIALLAAPKFAVDEIQIDGHAGREPGDSAIRASPWDSPAVEKRIIFF